MGLSIMQPVDGQDVNVLNYYKQNNIPHSWQCSRCGGWMGAEDQSKNCTHTWVIRDLRPFNKAGDVIQNAPSSRDVSVS